MKTEIKKQENQTIKASDIFTNLIVKEFTDNPVNGQGLSPFHKRLCQNYFIVIDGVLKDAEIKRASKNNSNKTMPIKWENVNMNQLALDVVAAARVGLDPAQPNHINMIPYKNNHTEKYDIGFIPGYKGMELKAVKYGLEVPKYIIVKLVYSKETFTPIYKDNENKVESYIHKPAKNTFDKGDVIGGYYYKVFDNPEKNELVDFSIKDIEKRKPKYASAEFWGGEKDKWENGQKVGKETVEGWFEEMCLKTIKRAAWNSITIDSSKIDDDFIRLSENENIRKNDNNEMAPNSKMLSFEDDEPENKNVINISAVNHDEKETKQQDNPESSNNVPY